MILIRHLKHCYNGAKGCYMNLHCQRTTKAEEIDFLENDVLEDTSNHIADQGPRGALFVWFLGDRKKRIDIP